MPRNRLHDISPFSFAAVKTVGGVIKLRWELGGRDQKCRVEGVFTYLRIWQPGVPV
jgi:hypothetical protein